MPWVVSFAGQKGGVGKSILSQGFAVASVEAGDKVILGDLDIAQRTTYEWGQWREKSKILPAVDVRLIDPDRSPDFGIRAMGDDVGLLVLDAPGWSDEKTLLLAGYSDLLVLPTGASVADLRPTLRLIFELQEKGVEPSRIITALCRIHTDAEIKFAKDYLAEAGTVAAAGALREQAEFQRLANQGKSICEATGSGMRSQAIKLVGSIRDSLRQEQQRQQAKPMVFHAEPKIFKGNAR